MLNAEDDGYHVKETENSTHGFLFPSSFVVNILVMLKL